MDRKSFIVLTVCGALFLLWVYLNPRLYPPVAHPSASGTNMASASTNAMIQSPAATGTNTTAVSNPPKGFLQPATNTPEETLLLSNALVRMTFTSRGGGIKLVELLQHRESVTCRARKQ